MMTPPCLAKELKHEFVSDNIDVVEMEVRNSWARDTAPTYLGVQKVIWLGQGLEGDATKGHVDILACFARPGVVMVHNCLTEGDHNKGVSEDAIQRLENATDVRGRKFEVVRLP